MTVQSVGSFIAGMNAVPNQAGKSAATDSFSTVMSSRVNESKTNEAAARKQSDQKNRISKSQNRSSVNDRQSVKDATDKATTKDKTNEVLGEVTEEKVSATDLEDVLATLATLLNQITDLLKQNLAVTEEELSGQAISLGLEPADLFTGQGLKELFLGLNDAQPEELLTNEELLNQFEDLQEQINSLFEEAGLNGTELFDKLEALTNGENILESPAFGEVLNEYLTGEAEEPQIEIKDLRPEVQLQATTEADEENTAIKPVENSEDDLFETEDQAKNPFIEANSFIKNLAKAAEESQIEEPVQPNTFRDLYNITGQTIEHIKVTLNADTSNMELQLNPAHLGKVNVQITSENGAVKAEITAHTEAAKRALEAGLEDLKVALEQTGLKVENVEVALADFGFRQRNDNETGDNHGNSQRQRRRGMNGIESDATLAEDMEETREIMKELNGNSVDYVV